MRTDEYERMYEAEDRHWWYTGLRALIRRDLARVLGAAKSPRLFDAGCGTGRNLVMLNEFGTSVGLDLSGDALMFCRRRSLDRLARASLLDLPWKSSCFDAAISMDVLYHVWIESDDHALRELHRVLKPNGFLIMQVAAFEFLRGSHDVVVCTRERYTASDLRRKLKACGFNVLKLTYRNSLLLPIVLLVRKLSSTQIDDARSDVALPHPFVNKLLASVLAVENFVLRWINLPIGSSVYCVAQKVG